MSGYYRDISDSSVSKMTRTSALAVAALLLSLASPDLIADDDSPSLFVAANGVDKGDCINALAPCRTIHYALQKVGKNGQIRVGDGSFELSDPADAIYLLSGAIDARGSLQGGQGTTLIGAPAEFAGDLNAKGFRVIADTKGLHRATVQSQLSLKSNSAATDCVGGMAGSFPCSNIDLLAHIADRTPVSRGADIWGFMDLNSNREYVVVSYSTGVAVFDVTDPEDPREIDFINGQSTTWRDIKIHQFWNASDGRWNAYAYVSADSASDGLFVIDLSRLPHSISRVSYNSDFEEAHNIYLLGAEFSTGLANSSDTPNLILAGANRSDGRFRAYNLANSASPAFIAAPQTPSNQPGGDRLYMHDAASMVVTDARKDSQCVNAAGQDHCDILFDFNEDSADIWDVSDPQNPSRLSRFPYSNSAYTHSGWPSEDQQYLFIQDELDEQDNGLSTTLRVVSIADLTAPTLAGTWVGPTRAIDHNGFVRGNRYYMSNYARGLTVLDITNAASPVAVGRFDTFPSSDNTGFPGNWGTYPFLPSGNIALSDIDSGFYMVADNTLNSAQGSLSFSTTAYGADETQNLDLVVERNGGSQGSASVSWQLIAATGDTSDVTTTSGVLNWASGDSSSRTISLGLNNDGNVEGLERVLIKLLAPTGGATIASPTIASAYISDPGAAVGVQFERSVIDIAERGFATAVAVVHRTGSASGAISVDYAVTAGDATNGSDYTGAANGTLNWADGDADPLWIEFPITDDGSGEADEFFEVTLSNLSSGAIGANNILRVNIADGTGINNPPNSVAGASQTVAAGATVTLDGSGSNDVDGDTLSYAWSQTMGPNVTLSNANTATASFVAPSVASDTLLRFELQVSDTGGLADTSQASVTVSGTSSAGGGGGGGSGSAWLLLGLLGFGLFSRRDAS